MSFSNFYKYKVNIKLINDKKFKNLKLNLKKIFNDKKNLKFGTPRNSEGWI